MRLHTLAYRSAVHYRRTNLAVVLGIACAVTVLAGALIVGESVRASLRELSIGRLGRTDIATTSEHVFREALADEMSSSGSPSVPVLLADAVVSDERSGQRAARVQVAGVDNRFWRFHGVSAPGGGTEERSGVTAWISPGLSRELAFTAGDTLLVRTRRPSEIPAEFLHGRRDDTGRTIRLRGAGVLDRQHLGEFSLARQQGETRTMFVPLGRLQRELQVPGGANAILGSGDRARVERTLRQRITLEDVGLRIRELPASAWSVEHAGGLLDAVTERAVLDAARMSGLTARPLLTYVVNTIRALPAEGGRAASVSAREVSYSLITGVEGTDEGDGSIALNDWAARELEAVPGEAVEIEYYLWTDAGRLDTRRARFRISRVVPVTFADKDFAPDYPGISDTDSLADWDPPFPVDLSRVRPQDEDYWDTYRTTPKAFIQLAAARKLWGSRWGQLTSIRLEGSPDRLKAFEQHLRERLDPSAAGLATAAVREDALRASTGATDFGQYFTYFSFFITVSALLLAALFFRLGVEQRVQQVGLFRAIGFPPARVRTLFLAEAAVLTAAGTVLGMLAAVGYAWLIMLALRTWWVGAVGTTLLELHASWAALLIGGAAGAVVGLITLVYTLAALRRASPRALLAGDMTAALTKGEGRGAAAFRIAAVALALAALLVLGLAGLELIPDAVGFFGSGLLILAAAIAAFGASLGAARRSAIAPGLRAPLARLGWRYASWRRGRSLLSAALIASAVFLIVSVEAFRRDDRPVPTDRGSGTGGASLIAESLLPIVHDPNSVEGRDALNLAPDGSTPDVPRFTLMPFRLSDGDEASCVNLFRPQKPRIIGVSGAFIQQNRFTFGKTLAGTPAERANPWTLLNRPTRDNVIPAIADATSLQYVLHAAVGDEIDAGRSSATGRPVRLLIVGALADSVLQGEIAIAASAFTAAFPDEDGFRFFLVDLTDPGRAGEAAAFLEGRLLDFGFDATSAADRLASFHRVENTYLSTFQSLGALGLLIGTFGLAVVSVRNVLERRRELALLQAVGYRSRDLVAIVISENTLLLGVGLGAGLVAAFTAIAPVIADRGGGPAIGSLALLLGAVAVAGLAATGLAAWTSARTPLLQSLRSE